MFVLLSAVRLTSLAVVAVMVATQVSSMLSTPRFFQPKPVKSSKIAHVPGPLYRPVARPHNFAFNPAVETSNLAAPRAFVRPDCPPDVTEQVQSKQSQVSQGRLAAQNVSNSARSALEQVSVAFGTLALQSDVPFGAHDSISWHWCASVLIAVQVSFFTNNKLQEEKRQANGLFGLFGL